LVDFFIPWFYNVSVTYYLVKQLTGIFSQLRGEKMKKIIGVFIALIGFILSPLSWWNDLFINIPLAYAVAYLFHLISRSFFIVFLIAYLGTNVLGLILMQKGTERMVGRKYRFTFLESFAVSVFYVIIVVVLMLWEIIPIPKTYYGG